MKYIVLRVAISDNLAKEIPFIFPEALVHAEVAERVSIMLASVGKVTVVSAGQLSSLCIDADCYGESTTLKIKSRGQEDNELIRMYDYMNGVV